MNEIMYKPEGTDFCSGTDFSLFELEKAREEGRILEAIATRCDADFSLHVGLGEIAGLMRKEEVALPSPGEKVKDIAVITRVGKPVCFKVLGFDRVGGKTVAILSRREAQKECLHTYLLSLVPGDVITAKVTHLEPFGAFADVGCGIVSLLPIDSLSVSRISHPCDRLAPGMEIRVAVKSIDKATGRLYLTQKELLGTWEENAAAFAVGQTVSGIVRSVESYGIFIELAPNLAGLAEPAGGIEVGQRAAVFIKNMIPEKMKIKLVVVDTYPPLPVPPPPPVYFDFSKHIDRWVYSPACAFKKTETVFTEAP